MEQEFIRLHFFDQDHEIPVEEVLDSRTSLSTGRTLRHVSVGFDVEAAKAQEVNTLLAAARDPGHPIVGEGGVCWSVVSSSHSYREGDAVHRFQAGIQEMEPPPEAERVEMLGLSLVPLRYKEEEFGGALLISLLVSLGSDEDSALARAIERGRAEQDYFEALRVGVSDRPLSVRFGRCLWKRQDGPPLRLLRLVADAEVSSDESPLLQIHQPELIRAQEKVAALEDVVSSLIDHLVGAKALNENAREAIRMAADDSWERHVNDFDEVIEIEKFF